MGRFIIFAAFVLVTTSPGSVYGASTSSDSTNFHIFLGGGFDIPLRKKLEFLEFRKMRPARLAGILLNITDPGRDPNNKFGIFVSINIWPNTEEKLLKGCTLGIGWRRFSTVAGIIGISSRLNSCNKYRQFLTIGAGGAVPTDPSKLKEVFHINRNLQPLHPRLSKGRYAILLSIKLRTDDCVSSVRPFSLRHQALIHQKRG